eukprot:2032067-Prymnesium_polylepis.3
MRATWYLLATGLACMACSVADAATRGGGCPWRVVLGKKWAGKGCEVDFLFLIVHLGRGGVRSVSRACVSRATVERLRTCT